VTDSSLPVRPGAPRSARRPGRTRRLAAATAAGLALTLTACSGENSGADSGGSTLDEDAAWSQVSLPDSAALSGERVEITAALGATAGLPRLLAGVGADPGQPDSARVWTDQADGSGWRWDDLSLPADRDDSVSFAGTDGSTTWVGGTTWSAGEPTQPYLRTSADRRSWDDVVLPDAAIERSVVPAGAVAVGDGLLVVGSDAEYAPVAVLTGQDGSVADLPALPGGREFRGFTGVAALGGTVVAVGGTGATGQTPETVVFRSADGGATWTVALAPAQGGAEVRGIATAVDGFVATGLTWGTDGQTTAAAWSSTDGLTWAAEALPTLDYDRDGIYVAEGEGSSLGAPTTGAGRLVAAMVPDRDLSMAVLNRDAGGVWTVAGLARDWIDPGSVGLTAVNEDGTVLVARSARNTAQLGTVTTAGAWKTEGVVLGTEDAGVTPTGFLALGDVPEFAGYRVVVETYASGGWMQSADLQRYTLDGASSASESVWEPAGSQDMATLSSAGTADGATVLLGSLVTQGIDGRNNVNVAGWSRTSPDSAWTPVVGLETGRAEQLMNVAAVPGGWVGVGVTRPDFNSGVNQEAGVWTSVDGVTWGRSEVPGGAVDGGDVEASNACALPGGDVLVVGYVTQGGQNQPRAWRRTGDQWQQVDPAAFSSTGSLSSCATQGDATLVQGTSGGAPTVWRTADGSTFESAPLGERGDTFGPIRVIDGGFAAAGTQGSHGRADAVVWLSSDGRTWHGTTIPADRKIYGTDVVARDGSLVLAAGSSSAPQLWVLANPGELMTGD
jgi:hypothetical protein